MGSYVLAVGDSYDKSDKALMFFAVLSICATESTKAVLCAEWLGWSSLERSYVWYLKNNEGLLLD